MPGAEEEGVPQKGRMGDWVRAGRDRRGQGRIFQDLERCVLIHEVEEEILQMLVLLMFKGEV